MKAKNILQALIILIEDSSKEFDTCSPANWYSPVQGKHQTRSGKQQGKFCVRRNKGDLALASS